MIIQAMSKRISLLTALAVMASGAALRPVQGNVQAAAVSISAAAITGSVSHNFTADGTAGSYFDITGNLSTGKGTMTYNGLTLTQCLKMESTTSVAFTTASDMTLTLAIKDGTTFLLDGAAKNIPADGIFTAVLPAGSHEIKKGSGSSNLFYIALTGGSSQPVTTTTQQSEIPAGTTVTTASTQGGGGQTVSGNLKLVTSGGWNEMLFAVISGVTDAQVTGVSYSGKTSGRLSGDDLTYLVRDTSQGVRIDIPGLPAGTYSLSIETQKGNATISGISVTAQDSSGYAHFNYTAGVGAYKDDGTLKDNAIVLYVTESNKDTVTLKSKDGTTVSGIGNILNSSGKESSGGKTSKGGAANTNKGIIEKIAKDGTPLVIRIIGDVKAPSGLTAYDSVDYGGSVGDNGFMARMQSGKDVTIEGIGSDATVNGWGFHFICESGNPNLGKSFEVRNLKFRNVPEDCIGMEGVQEGSTLTASVEHCWIHNNEFYKPSISNPAESDKAGGDGACDFKRGMYFTNSYNYYEGYHKTNLVGASDSNLQFHITFHHNYWKACESRGPLARQANIHMYNNIFEGQTSYCQNPRADAYIFSEYNLFENSKNPQQIKQGAIKSFNDTLTNCKGDMQATVVTSKTAKVSSNNKYGDFDTNASLSYIPSNSYVLQTDTSSLKSYFAKNGGTLDDTSVSGSFAGSVVQPTATTTSATTTSTTTTSTTAATTSTTASAVTTTTVTTTSTTNSSSDSEDVPVAAVMRGDLDCSGAVDILDAVLMARLTGDDPTLKDGDVSAQGKANSDCDGNGLTDAFDLDRILRYLAKYISAL